jgi:hypothetical protein
MISWNYGVTFEDWCLLILVLQGFAVCWWEYKVYVLHNERFRERAKWREQKRKTQLRVVIAEKMSHGPSPLDSSNVLGGESVKNV